MGLQVHIHHSLIRVLSDKVTVMTLSKASRLKVARDANSGGAGGKVTGRPNTITRVTRESLKSGIPLLVINAE